RSLQGAHLVRRRHGFDRRVVRTPFSATFEDLHFRFPRGIAVVDREEGPVDLGLGEWMGAFGLARGLRRDHEGRQAKRDRPARAARIAGSARASTGLLPTIPRARASRSDPLASATAASFTARPPCARGPPGTSA